VCARVGALTGGYDRASVGTDCATGARWTIGLVTAALVLAACGSGSSAGGSGGGSQPSAGGANASPGQIRAAVSGYYTALAKHDPAGACRAMSPAFFAGTVQSLNAQLEGAGAKPLPSGSCTQALHRLFQLSPHAVTRPAQVSVINISVHGSAATAVLKNSNQSTPARFRRNDGVWQIDCCSGSQAQKQARTTYRIPSGSMEPTFKLGQTVTSDNAAARARPPALGEIVVVHPPRGADASAPTCGNPQEGNGHPRMCGQPTVAESAETLIKRVVGLPGDRIALVGGRVTRNGTRLSEPYVRPCSDPACTFRQPVVIPAGDYFLLGDNRGASDDSRFLGPVPRAWIIGLVKSGG
jgi:signal peptidase I